MMKTAGMWTRPYTRPPRSSAGMSLIELMIAIALGLLILAGLTVVFVNTSTARRELELTGQQVENGRYAIDLLADDLRMAGYFGELNPGPANEAANSTSDTDWLPVVVAPAPGALPDPCAIPADLKDLRPSLYFHVQGYANGTGLAAECANKIAAAGTSVKANADATTNPDVVVVRRTRACTEGDAGCPAVNSNKAYLQVTLCTSELPAAPYILALGSVVPTLRYKGATTGTCSPTIVSRREYMTHVYFVSPDNGAGVNVPTLKRLEMDVVGGSLSMRVVSLVEGIEQLNVEYGIDYMDSAGLPNVDGIPDAYTSDPTNFADATGCPTCVFNDVNNWQNAISARFYVLARNLEHSPGLSTEAKNKSYTLGRKADGSALVLGPFNDNFRRHVYSSLVRISNPAGRRDRP
jgi:type IV pilus assembly protein PilW